MHTIVLKFRRRFTKAKKNIIYLFNLAMANEKKEDFGYFLEFP